MGEHNHKELLNRVENEMANEMDIVSLANLFSIFGDKTRIKILYALTISEMCVCAISDLINMSQSAVSHQLKILRDANLVKIRREGKTIFYSLADDHVSTIIGQGYDHILEDKGE